MRLSFSVRDQDVYVLDNAPPLTVLQSELERIIGNLKGSTFCETKANLCHVTNRRNRIG